MTRRARSGQSMVELALGVAIFLLASLGAVQLGLLALAEEGVQSAALTGARTASSALFGTDPVTNLKQGATAAAAALDGVDAGMATATICAGTRGTGCWNLMECVRYQGGLPQPGTEMPCSSVAIAGRGGTSYGPIPADLDGSQNPRCYGGDCFGVAQTMSNCATVSGPGRLHICVAYTSWPPRAVDVWVSGGLRSIIPWIGSSGPGAIPVGSRMRLEVEQFAP